MRVLSLLLVCLFLPGIPAAVDARPRRERTEERKKRERSRKERSSAREHRKKAAVASRPAEPAHVYLRLSDPNAPCDPQLRIGWAEYQHCIEALRTRRSQR